VGDFPYACQRLTKSDLERYFESAYPEQSGTVSNRYDYFHKGTRPTAHDYMDMGLEYGLIPKGFRRLSPQSVHRRKTPVPPNVISKHRPGYLRDVLNDIHQFRQDVRLEDLYTAFVMGVFKKESQKRESLQDYFEMLKEKSLDKPISGGE